VVGSEFPAAQDVRLKVDGCGPDPHGQQGLDSISRQFVTRSGSLTNRITNAPAARAQRREDPSGTGKLKDRLLDFVLVVVADHRKQPPH
jgi:hypothetical protein